MAEEIPEAVPRELLGEVSEELLEPAEVHRKHQTNDASREGETEEAEEECEELVPQGKDVLPGSSR